MSIKGRGHSLTLVKGHSDFKVKCLSFGLYTQVSDSGPPGLLVIIYGHGGHFEFRIINHSSLVLYIHHINAKYEISLKLAQ